jgi:hypothetical protein
MRLSKLCYAVIATLSIANHVWAHGFLLSAITDGLGNPIALGTASQAQQLDLLASPTVGPYNVFLDKFGATATTDGTGTWYGVNGGSPATSGPWPAYTSATYTILSPLYFSDGTGAAVPASTGTYLQVADRFVADQVGHPGAAAGTVNITGTSLTQVGYGVSLYDVHELSKHLYLGAGSTQKFGEYGFAYNVTVHFAGGQTLISGTLVDVFSLTDPTLPGGSFALAPRAQQDAATLAVYNAVPEPSTVALAGTAAMVAGIAWLRRKRAAV